MQVRLGWFANPTFGNGDYPQIMKDMLKSLADKMGLPESPLPEFTEDEKKQNKGAHAIVFVS